MINYIFRRAFISWINALDKKLLRKIEFIESLDDSINEATHSVVKGSGKSECPDERRNSEMSKKKIEVANKKLPIPVAELPLLYVFTKYTHSVDNGTKRAVNW